MIEGSPTSNPQPGKQVAASFQLQGDAGRIQYLLFVPQDYRVDGDEWPLMLFLHGAGERGTDLQLVKKHGPPRIVETNPAFPCIVVSPQCPEHQRWDPESLIQLVNHVVATLQVDQRRLYVTGLSMGGYGTWALCTAYPDRFAAALPICGGGNASKAGDLKSLPIWAIHGERDRIVVLQQSQEMVQAVQSAGGTVKFTIYPEVAHDSWTETYANPEIYDWLLAQRRP